MVRAVFRPEAKLTLFLRMRPKEIAKNIAKMYSDGRVIHLIQKIYVEEANVEVRFLPGSSRVGVFVHAQ